LKFKALGALFIHSAYFILEKGTLK
jgi:hypothetical protein